MKQHRRGRTSIHLALSILAIANEPLELGMCHILPRVSMANEGIRIGNWIY
jgi:hypothetical protein